MYTIDQEVANRIAQTHTMKYKEMEKLFFMKEEEADEYEMNLRNEVQRQSDDTVARAVVAVLPLYLENHAITKYINKTGKRMLRNMMPEILTAEEAALIAQKDIMTMDDAQRKKTTQIIEKYKIALK